MAKAYLVPTFHHDIAYLRPEEEYTARCLEILDEALDILRDNREYHYFLEQAWLLEEYWDARPEKRGLMRELAREGRLRVEPGLYAVPDMNLPDGESQYMHATVGRRIVKEKLGIDPRVCMIADCWGHHAQIPQIFSQCGYDYYAFSRCMRYDAARQNFIWRGADGSTLRGHWMSTHYDGIGFPSAGENENADELEWAEGEQGIARLMEKNREACGDDPQYLPVGGDMRFPSRLAPKIVKALNARGNLPELVFAAPGDALDKVDWNSAPVFEGEFVSSMQGTFATNIWIKQKDRHYAGEIYALEALSAALGAQKDFSLAWKLHLKNQFHDIICGTICNRAVRDVEADFRALGHLLDGIRRDLTGGVSEEAYFNALPFSISVRTGDGILDVPGLGFARASEAKAPNARPEEPTLPLSYENGWYRAHMDEKGYIVSLCEKSTGRELVAPGDAAGRRVPFGALTMQQDKGDSWWELSVPRLTRENQPFTHNRPDPLFRDDMNTFLPRILEAKVVAADEDRVVIRQTGELRFWITHVSFTTTITLSQSHPEIAYHTEFTCESKDMRLRAAFPVNALPEARRQIPFAISGLEGEQATQMFMDARDDRAGLAVINCGTPSGNVEEGVMMLTLFRSAAMEYKCDSDLSYNLGRTFDFDYAVCPHAAQDDALIWRSALAMNTPVIRCPLPERAALPKVEDAYLSCVRETEHGLFLRLYNPADEEAECRVTLPAPYSAIVFADGLGQLMADAQPLGSDGKIKLGAKKVQGILCR